MCSSSRIIHGSPGVSRGTSVPGSPGAAAAGTVGPARTVGPAGASPRGAGHSAILRGRGFPSNRERPAGAEAIAAVDGLAVSGAALPPEVAAQLRELQRIAEDRGYATGRALAAAEFDAAIDAAGSLSLRLEAMAPRETTVVAHAIAELALAIARRVVEAELHIDPAILIHALESAISSINGSPEAHVLLNPATVEAVRVAWETTHGLGYLGKRWSFEADPSLPIGGCILRYEHGFVDAGLEAQIEEIGIALDGAIPAFWHGDDEEAGAA